MPTGVRVCNPCTYVCPPGRSVVRVLRVKSNISSFSNRNTITSIQISSNSNLRGVIIGSKKVEIYNLEWDTHNNPSGNRDVSNSKSYTNVVLRYRNRPGHS